VLSSCISSRKAFAFVMLSSLQRVSSRNKLENDKPVPIFDLGLAFI
jgi:hypothetical protein